ncbi:MAG: hypothetical protein ACLTSX_00505 [Collinsella sp.]
MAITSKTANKTERKAQGLAKGPVAAAQPNLMLTDDDIHLFGTGMWQRAWEKMGAHKDVQGNSELAFPRLGLGSQACVVGDFNGWDPRRNAAAYAPACDIEQRPRPDLSRDRFTNT